MVDKKLKSFHSDYIIDAYNILGSFFEEEKTTFRVYAPHATSISVVGDFNNWDYTLNPMTKITRKGVWECAVSGAKLLDRYKYRIVNNDKVYLKQDLYSYLNETDGKSSSLIYNIDRYNWRDEKWMLNRTFKNVYNLPMNIYEVHLGSWKTYNNNDNNQDSNVNIKFLNYRDIALKLIPYVKEMGYNYIELLPITEHPYLGSWGYQVTGYYSVTSRYGYPDDFKFLIDYAHQNGIGVILDWVPAHFPKDDFGLVEYDGKYVYEETNAKKREFKTWGTRMFKFGKSEVKSFLISSASFFFEKYHIDGLRVDAVASMLYLDYDRDKFVLNKFGEKYNLEAIEFLKCLNKEMFNKYGNILMIAEESTSFPKITHPVEDGGLGFNYKWCMGWMHDSLHYISTDPYFRQHIHNNMTFTLSYFYGENYVLPLSHDEVVHCKGSLINKAHGEYDMKFANLRLYYMYMMTHPGKKLSFMGNEFGQFAEWDENKEIDWFLLDYPKHKALHNFVKDLNHVYLNYPNLYEIDHHWDGFEWIVSDDKMRNVYAYIRKCSSGNDMVVILNFSGVTLSNYEIHHKGLKGTYKIILNSDDLKYGGEEYKVKNEVKVVNNKIKVTIPKLSGLILYEQR